MWIPPGTARGRTIAEVQTDPVVTRYGLGKSLQSALKIVETAEQFSFHSAYIYLITQRSM